jgi:hypothetical protein
MARVLSFFRRHTPEHQPSIEIIAALSAIPRTVAQIARGEAEPKFYVCPLATGTGKTVTLIHALRLLREWDHYRGLGLILCANRLDQIEAMVEELRLGHDDFAVYVAADAKNEKFHNMGRGRDNAGAAPILITTHAMVLRRLRGRSWSEASEFFFKGAPRAIRVWDEAMLPGLPITLTVPDLQGILSRTERLPGFYRALDEVVDTTKQAEDKALIDLPDFEALTAREDLMEAVEGKDHAAAELLWSLSGRTVRIRQDGQNYGTAVLDYNEALPDDAKPMLVLDASAAVRATYAQHAKHRQDLVELPGRDLKKCRNVTFHVLDRGAGKATFRKRYDEYLAAIGEVVNRAPGKVLVVHFKDLTRFRDDLDQFLSDEVKADQEKIQCLTWGRHDATNEHRDCTTVILAGTPFYRRSQYEALGRAAAAKRAPQEYPKRDQDDITLGELRHHVLQAASRGSLRLCNGDQATTCDVWLITDRRNGLRQELEVIFPQAEVVDWDADDDLKSAKRRLSKKARAVAAVVREWFESDTGDPLFFTDVRQRVGEKDRTNFNKLVASQGFQRLLDQAKIRVRTVENRKAFVHITSSYDLLEQHWLELGVELEGLQERLWDLEEAGDDGGPEYEKVHKRFMEVASQLGLVH